MSSDEQHQAYGRIMDEYLDAKKKLVALESEAKKMADILSILSDALKTPAIYVQTSIFDNRIAECPTPEKMKEVFAEIKAIREKKTQAENQLKELGFDVK